MAKKIGVTELNEILLNSMPNSWSMQAYAQGFDCDSISFKKAAGMFELMEISKSIYEGVLKPSYKKTTQAEYNYTGLNRNKKAETAFVKYSPNEEWERCQGP